MFRRHELAGGEWELLLELLARILSFLPARALLDLRTVYSELKYLTNDSSHIRDNLFRRARRVRSHKGGIRPLQMSL